MSKPNYLINWEYRWLAIGDLLGILVVERSRNNISVTPRLGFIGEFFMRKAGLRHPVGGSKE